MLLKPTTCILVGKMAETSHVKYAVSYKGNFHTTGDNKSHKCSWGFPFRAFFV